MSKIRGIKLLRRPKQLTGILVGVDGDVPYIQKFDLRTIKLFKDSSSLSIVRSISPLCVAKKNVVPGFFRISVTHCTLPCVINVVIFEIFL